jgi:hypothetical protein
MEPLLIESGSRHRGELTDLALELAAKSSGFRRSLVPGVLAALSDLVRAMNCYYSNLIEGHDTHPVDIERALKNEYSAEPEKRDLQLEAKAHITVQQWIDQDGLKGRAVTSDSLTLRAERRCASCRGRCAAAMSRSAGTCRSAPAPCRVFSNGSSRYTAALAKRRASLPLPARIATPAEPSCSNFPRERVHSLTRCMVRPCVARGFVDLAVCGLASMYPASAWSALGDALSGGKTGFGDGQAEAGSWRARGRRGGPSVGHGGERRLPF